jgi:hypothetical protein
MTLEQLEDSLPNGFHDADIESITVDYVSKSAVLRMNLWTGDLDAANEQEREACRRAELHLSDLVYFVIEPPDSKSDFKKKGGVWVTAGRHEEGKAPLPPVAAELLPAGGFAHWFFVIDWNSFISVAAMNAELRWL